VRAEGKTLFRPSPTLFDHGKSGDGRWAHQATLFVFFHSQAPRNKYLPDPSSGPFIPFLSCVGYPAIFSYSLTLSVYPDQYNSISSQIFSHFQINITIGGTIE
jgi:hypothetical protein